MSVMRQKSALVLLVMLTGLIIMLTSCSLPSNSGSISSVTEDTQQGLALAEQTAEVSREEIIDSIPLHLPTTNPGDVCPRMQGKQVNPRFGTAVGTGPVYAAGLGVKGILYVEYPPPEQSVFFGSQWGGQKVLWVIDPAYRGSVMIRGHQLDGPEEVRFGQEREPVTELHIPAADANNDMSWREHPSYTRIRKYGCYAYQVNGDGFSDIIIFEAISAP